MGLAWLAAAVVGAAPAGGDMCPNLTVSAPPTSGGVVGVTVAGPTKQVPPPRVHVPAPHGELSTVSIALERGFSFAASPVYSIVISGDGTVIYDGTSDVLIIGKHRSIIDTREVRCLLQQFEQADFCGIR